MTIKVRAIYDGKALRLSEPLDIAPETEVEVTVELYPEPEEQESGQEYSFFRVAGKIAIDEGPTDWSTRYEEYLYPDPPKSHRDDEE
ncbi:MAG: hypothetical protein R2849_15450 [Thermomicrobiales bacterium]